MHFYTHSYPYFAMSKQTRYFSIFICRKHCSCFAFQILCQANSFNFILQQSVLLIFMTICLNLTHSYVCRFILLFYLMLTYEQLFGSVLIRSDHPWSWLWELCESGYVCHVDEMSVCGCVRRALDKIRSVFVIYLNSFLIYSQTSSSSRVVSGGIVKMKKKKVVCMAVLCDCTIAFRAQNSVTTS